MRGAQTILLLGVTLLLNGVALEMYGGNLIRYGTIRPHAEDTIPLEVALNNRITRRNWIVREFKASRLTYDQALSEVQKINNAGNRRRAIQLLDLSRDPEHLQGDLGRPRCLFHGLDENHAAPSIWLPRERRQSCASFYTRDHHCPFACPLQRRFVPFRNTGARQEHRTDLCIYRQFRIHDVPDMFCELPNLPKFWSDRLCSKRAISVPGLSTSVFGCCPIWNRQIVIAYASRLLNFHRYFLPIQRPPAITIEPGAVLVSRGARILRMRILISLLLRPSARIKK